VHEVRFTAGVVQPPSDSATAPYQRAEQGAHVRGVVLPDVAEAMILRHPNGAPTSRTSSDLVVQDGAYVACCPQSAIMVIAAQSTARGRLIESISHADFAWAAALSAAAGPTARGLCAVQCRRGQSHIRLIGVDGSEVVALRRLPLTVDDATLQAGVEDVADERGAHEFACLPLGDEDFRKRIEAAASAVGLRVIASEGRLDQIGHQPEVVAAAFAGAGPRFVPPEVAAAAKSKNRRRATLSAVAASILVVLVGALDTVDARRELAAVQRARTAHLADVASLMDARVRTADLEVAATALAAARAEHPRWTLVLSSLADGVPAGTRLTSLISRDDSLFIELEGSDAAAAFEAVRAIPWLGEFRSIAPVQREIGAASKLTERLTASAVVSWAAFEASDSRR
jgi:hypothetical protein